jgi:hypothetical protein
VRAVDRGVVHVQQACRAEFREEDGVQAGPDAGLGPVPQTPPARHPAAADRLGRHVRPGHTGGTAGDDLAATGGSSVTPVIAVALVAAGGVTVLFLRKPKTT